MKGLKFSGSLMIAVAALAMGTLLYAERPEADFVISDVKEFAKEYIYAIQELDKVNPEAAVEFQNELIQGLENGRIRFKDERVDLHNETPKANIKERTVNKAEPVDNILLHKTEKRADADTIRDSDSYASRHGRKETETFDDPGHGHGGGGDKPKGKDKTLAD